MRIAFSARWGRCQEGYGEDPYLQAQLATQYVTALQNMNSSKYVEAIVSQKSDHDRRGYKNNNNKYRQLASILMFMLVLKTFQKVVSSLMPLLATETGLRPFSQHSKHVLKLEPCPTCAATMPSMECLPVPIESC